MSTQAATHTEMFFQGGDMANGERMAFDQAIDVHEILVYDFTRWREIFHYMTVPEQKITSDFLEELNELEHRPEEVFELSRGFLWPPSRKWWEDCKTRYMVKIGDMESDYLKSQKEGLEALTKVMYRHVMAGKQEDDIHIGKTNVSSPDVEEITDMVPDDTDGRPNTSEEMPNATFSLGDMGYQHDELTGTSGSVSTTGSSATSPAASDTTVSVTSGSHDVLVSLDKKPTRESGKVDLREAAKIRRMHKLAYRRRKSSVSGNLQSMTSVSANQNLPVSLTAEPSVLRSESLCASDADDEWY